jgi:hypothetical protein
MAEIVVELQGDQGHLHTTERVEPPSSHGFLHLKLDGG